VRGHLLLTNCIEDEVTRPNIELALKENKLLWLDLQDTDDETLSLLREVFKIHVMRQLTIIATVFLPLSFLTGFFGQNFAWLVSRIGSTAAFFGIGVGTEVLAVAALLYMFRKRGWMGRGGTH